MYIKTISGIFIGGLVGGLIGWKMQCLGGACPLTCNPWGGAITGAVFGFLITST